MRPVNFGILKLGLDEVIELKGQINCPFDFIDFTINDSMVNLANLHCVTWMQKQGLIPESQAAQEKICKLDFARFAYFTHIAFDLTGISSAQDVPGKTSFDKINWLMQNKTQPLSQDNLNDAALWLNFLFPLEDRLEHLDHLELMDGFIDSANSILKFSQFSTLDSSLIDQLKTHNEAHDAKLQEDFLALNQTLKALFQIHNAFIEKYTRSSDSKGDRSGEFIDYSDLAVEIIRYLTGNKEEMQNRLEEKEIDVEHFTAKQSFASGVYTVYMMSVLTTGLNIPKETRIEAQISQAENDFSHIICRTNAFFSAAREAETSNWLHNDLAVIHRNQTEFIPDIPHNLIVKMLFSKISKDMEDAENVLRKFTGDIKSLLYIAIILKWGIGSIPAQLCTPRYFKLTESGEKKPFVDQARKQEVGSNYWDFLK